MLKRITFRARRSTTDIKWRWWSNRGKNQNPQKTPGPKISHHKSWDCFEYPKKSLLKSSHPIQYFPNFPTQKNPRFADFKAKNILRSSPSLEIRSTILPSGISQHFFISSSFLSSCKTQLNPLSPNSDQQQLSPNNVHTLSRDKVVRNIKNDHERENASMFY